MVSRWATRSRISSSVLPAIRWLMSRTSASGQGLQKTMLVPAFSSPRCAPGRIS